jgi:hypothetical protein
MRRSVDVDLGSSVAFARCARPPQARSRRSRRVRAPTRSIEASDARVVDADHRGPARTSACEERIERVDDVIEVAVDLGMVELDVGHDGDIRGVGEERAVGLIGLRDRDRVRTGMRVRARLVELAADRERRIERRRACSATTTIEVVVVFPCVPATRTERSAAMMAASMLARGTTGIPRSRAASDLRVVGRDGRRGHDELGVPTTCSAR